MTFEKWLYERLEAGTLETVLLKRLLSEVRSVAILGVLLELAYRQPGLLLGPLEPFVQSAVLYRWVRGRGFDHPASVAMIPWSLGHGDPKKYPEAVEWFSMKHRRTDLLQLVMWLSVQVGFEWPALNEALKGWSEALPLIADEDWRDWMRLVSATLDRRNWSDVSNEADTAMQFTPPADISEESQKVREEIVRTSSLSLIPLRCRQVLDGEVAVSTVELEGLVERAGGPEMVSPGDDVDVDCIRAGVAAIALASESEWMDAHADWKTKFVDWALGACERMAAIPAWSDTQPNWSAESFCSQAIPPLWLANPDDLKLREAMGRVATRSGFQATRKFFEVLALRRTECEEDFRRLLHVAVLRAAVSASTMRQHWLDEKPQAEPLLEQLAAGFVARSIQPLPDLFLENSHATLRLLAETGTALSSNVADDPFNLEHLVAAFAWIAPARMVPGSVEAAILTQLRDFVINRLLGRVQGREFENRLPSEAERRVIGWCAEASVSLADRTFARQCWQPWIDLPLTADNWIEALVRGLYEYGLAGERDASLEVAAREVLKYALGTGGVLNRPDASMLGVGVATALIGFHRYARQSQHWTAERRNLVLNLRDLWKAWLDLVAGWRFCAVAMLNLLCTPAAIDVRVDALSWLDTARERWLDAEDDQVRIALLEFLEVLLAEHGSALQGPGKARHSFDRLVAVLVGRSEPRALMLVEKMARSTNE